MNTEAQDHELDLKVNANRPNGARLPDADIPAPAYCPICLGHVPYTPGGCCATEDCPNNGCSVEDTLSYAERNDRLVYAALHPDRAHDWLCAAYEVAVKSDRVEEWVTEFTRNDVMWDFDMLTEAARDWNEA